VKKLDAKAAAEAVLASPAKQKIYNLRLRSQERPRPGIVPLEMEDGLRSLRLNH
jgi:hypothetical protein